MMWVISAYSHKHFYRGQGQLPRLRTWHPRPRPRSRTLTPEPRPRPRTLSAGLEAPRGQGHVLEDSNFWNLVTSNGNWSQNSKDQPPTNDRLLWQMVHVQKCLSTVMFATALSAQ